MVALELARTFFWPSGTWGNRCLETLMFHGMVTGCVALTACFEHAKSFVLYAFCKRGEPWLGCNDGKTGTKYDWKD